MALFLNDGDSHVTIPDGRGGALIVPAGCEAVMGPEGILVARKHVPEPEPIVSFDDDPGDGLSAVVDGLVAGGELIEVSAEVAPAATGGTVEAQPGMALGDGSPELFVPAEPDGSGEALPPADPENPGPHEAPASGKARRGPKVNPA